MKPLKEKISITLDSPVLSRVKELAERSGVKYTTLVETTTGRCAGHQLIPVVREFMENFSRKEA